MDLLNHKISGTGRPLVILHGFLGSLDNWTTLAKKFSEDYQVVLVDQRNHGKSFHSAQFDYDVMVEDLEHLIDELKLDNPILLGHSMGGKTAMQFAAYHQDKIDKLIVADIGPKQYPIHHQRILEGLAKIPIAVLESRQQADDVLSEYVPESSTRTFLLKNIKRTAEGFAWKMNLPVLSTNIEQVGQALNYHFPIETKSLFIRGGGSDYIVDAEFSSIEEIFPDAIFDTVDGAGHWLHAEHPDEFYQKVMNFLSS